MPLFTKYYFRLRYWQSVIWSVLIAKASLISLVARVADLF